MFSSQTRCTHDEHLIFPFDWLSIHFKPLVVGDDDENDYGCWTRKHTRRGVERKPDVHSTRSCVTNNVCSQMNTNLSPTPSILFKVFWLIDSSHVFVIFDEAIDDAACVYIHLWHRRTSEKCFIITTKSVGETAKSGRVMSKVAAKTFLIIQLSIHWFGEGKKSCHYRGGISVSQSWELNTWWLCF